MNKELPYTFDLFYDIKTMDDVKKIAYGEPHCSDATPEDLVTLFIDLGLPVPDCLNGVMPNMDIYVYPDGIWEQADEPKQSTYRKVTIPSFER